ncbi:40S ribosomal protein L14, putative [Leishmania tarentolae]|uniref:40S ribosomal protein L14, putative n=1 Tax=Leishmania tarentolae TaxID=5689 RepID=A0A640KFX9_LEITA|nr:40S ribosomal protein L14, putative [Leishmania tarentolae]GET88626.1 40S ribosomal protein L14, putative [Leishmania tarentolae]
MALLFRLARSDRLLHAPLSALGRVHLCGLLLHPLQRNLVPRHGRLRVLIVEHLARPVRARAARNAQLVALEVRRRSERLLRLHARGSAGLRVLLQRLRRGQRILQRLRAAVAADAHAVLQRLHVLHVLHMAPHLRVLRVLHQHAVRVDNVDDHTNAVLAGATQNAHQPARADVVGLDHYAQCNTLRTARQQRREWCSVCVSV